MSVAHVATTSNTATGATTVAITLSTAGISRVLSAKVAVASGSLHLSTVFGGGLSWARKTPQGGTGGAAGLYYVEMWFAFASAQLTSQTITHSITGTGTDIAISISEYSGGDINSAGAAAAIAETTINNVMTGTVTTTQANSILDGGFIDDQVGSTHTPGLNTTESDVFDDGAGDQYYSLRSTASVSIAVNSLIETVSAISPDWVGAVLEIKEATAGSNPAEEDYWQPFRPIADEMTVTIYA